MTVVIDASIAVKWVLNEPLLSVVFYIPGALSVPVNAVIGAAWLAIAEHILDHGTPGSWDGEPLREVLRATVEVDAPALADPIIDRGRVYALGQGSSTL